MREAAALTWERSVDSVEAHHNSEMVEEISKSKEKAARQKKRPKVEYNRRTIEIHPEIEQMLDQMQGDLRLRSQTEVIQKAIQLLGVIMGVDGSGRRKIFIERPDGKLQELLII